MIRTILQDEVWIYTTQSHVIIECDVKPAYEDLFMTSVIRNACIIIDNGTVSVTGKQVFFKRISKIDNEVFTKEQVLKSNKLIDPKFITTGFLWWKKDILAPGTYEFKEVKPSIDFERIHIGNVIIRFNKGEKQ